MSEEDEGLRDWMREWFEQFMGRFDRLDKFMDIMSGRHNVLNGERLLDNQDLCQLLNVSERTLQRLRSNGQISYSILSGKSYYKIGEIKRILEEHLIKAGDDCLNDLIEHHKHYIEIRRKNKPDKKDSKP